MPHLQNLEHAATRARLHGHTIDHFDPDRRPPGFAITPCPNCGQADAIIESDGIAISIHCHACDDPNAIASLLIANPTQRNGHPTSHATRIKLRSLNTIKRRQVSLVPCGLNIPTGTISIICGTQGLGKSLVTCYAAAELTRHGHAAIFIAEEDSVETVIKPRLEAARANLDHVYFPEVATHDDLGGIVLPKDTSELATLAHHADVQLVVIDPWTNHLDVDVDKGAVRGALMPIARAARDNAFSVILVAHPTKRTEGNPLSQIAHASAVSQVARSAFMLAPDPEHPAETTRDNPYRLLTQEKGNLTEHAATLRFKIESILLPATNDEPEVHTATVTSAGTSMLDWAGITELERRRNHKPDVDTETGRAQALLQDLLCDGPKTSTDVYAAADDAGITRRTIQRAAQDLVIVTRRPPGASEWKLSIAPPIAPSKNDGAIGAMWRDGVTKPKNVIPAREPHGSTIAPIAPPSPSHRATWRDGEDDPPKPSLDDLPF